MICDMWQGQKGHNMLTYSFENVGSVSLYEYLYRCIRDDILAGRLAPDEKLPSKRTFAAHLGVSVITVETAYAQLIAEGYLYSRPRCGFFVERLAPQSRSAQPMTAVSIPQEQREQWNSDFVTNRIPPENFPFSTWSRLLRSVLSEQGEELMQPSSVQGRPELQQAIAQHLYSFRGMDVRPEQIVIGAGTEYLYGLLVQLLGRELCYGVEEPGYQKPAQIYRSNGARCVSVPMDECGVRADELNKKGVDILHISPSHHFPTGVVMPVTRRREILNWCAAEEEHYVLEDDYDCEFRASGRPIPTLQSIDTADRVIYINTFSKTLASAIRISYMVLPLSLVDAFRRKLGFYSCTVSVFDQLALAAFIREGLFEKHINRMRSHYRIQRDRILQRLRESELAPFLTVRMENEGLHFLLEVQGVRQDADLLAAAKENGVRISCLSQYYAGMPDCGHVIVVNYAGVSDKNIEAAVDALLRTIAAARQ